MLSIALEDTSITLPALLAIAPPWMIPRPCKYSRPHATWCSSDRIALYAQGTHTGESMRRADPLACQCAASQRAVA